MPWVDKTRLGSNRFMGSERINRLLFMQHYANGIRCERKTAGKIRLFMKFVGPVQLIHQTDKKNPDSISVIRVDVPRAGLEPALAL